MNDAVLSVRDLRLTFPGRPPVQALRGASLHVEPGEVLGLVGESGSGKTVLGLAALGLLPPVKGLRLEGDIDLGGLDMGRASEPERRARRGVYVGAVFQDPMASLNPTMRVGRQVAEAAGGVEEAEACSLLADAGVPEPARRARQYPHELSGGLRQRVMIAMAVARRPRLVVADEPTTALDVTVQAHVLRLLARLRDHGTSVLLVTHDLGVAATICDRIAVAYAGRIVECGPAAALIDAPQHPYTAGLLASRPRLDGPSGQALASLPGRMPDPRRPPEGCAFAARCPITAPVCAGHPAGRPAGSARTVECHRAGELAAWPAVTAVPKELRAVAASLEPALILEGIGRDFPLGRSRPPFRAVEDVSLRLRSGGALAVVGESGSGKTTLLRMVVGLLAPTRGTVTLGSGAAPQLVFQDAGASLTPWATIGGLLRERLAREGVPRRERPARVAAALDAVGLPEEVAGARPRELSGGQRQRAALARAVIVPPALLACDEPVSALDVSLAAQVLNLLGELRRRLGLTLLFVTHDLAVARAVAEEIVVMHDGRIVERGPAAEVLSQPSEPYTRELLAAVPRLRPAERRVGVEAVA